MTGGPWGEGGVEEVDGVHLLTPVARLRTGAADASESLSLAVESYGARYGVELLERLGSACAIWLRRGGRLVLARQVGAVAGEPVVEALLNAPLSNVLASARRSGGSVDVSGRLPDQSWWRVRILALPEGAMAAIWMARRADPAARVDPARPVDLGMPRRLMAHASGVSGLTDGNGQVRERATSLHRALIREAWKLLGQRGVGLPVDLRAVPLTAKLEAVQQRISRLIPDGVQAEWDIPPGLARVAVPGPAVRYIVEELTRNGLAAIEGDEGRIRFRGGVLDLDEDTVWHGLTLPFGTYVFVEVTDNGLGIEDERVEALARGHVVGSLQAVQGLARGWAGGLRIRSAPGRGTIVQVAFPAYGVERLKQPVRSPAPAPSTRIAGPCALVVMGAGQTCSRVVSGLEALGLDVTVVGDVGPAVERFRVRASTGGFALLVVAHVLPAGSGFDLVRRLRQVAPVLPVVLMTDDPVDEVEDDHPDLAPGRVVPLQYAARMAVGAASLLLPQLCARPD